MVVIVFGLPGSGKSYFASRVTQMLGASYISSDKVRKELFTTPAYSSEEKKLVYDEMLQLTTQAVEHGKDVVLDGTFYTNDLRKKIIWEIKQLTRVFFIEVIADDDLIKERLQQQRKDSDADFAVYKSIKEIWEPLNVDHHLVLQSTNDNITDMLERTADYLFSNDKEKH